jgi:hypothetical protein
MKTLILFLALCAPLAFAQVETTSTLDGTVVDQQGAVVVGAELVVINANNGQTFKASTDEHGHWVLPSMQAGVYTITVTLKGFRTLKIENVQLDAGTPATVPAKLELGAATETVEVTAGAELVQTTNATVNSTIEGKQVNELPNITRSALDLLVSQPGVQTATANRYSSINGLPNGALNLTLDGLNTQDNLLKSSNGFYTFIPILQDSVEQVTLTTAAAGADATGEGAAQMKFVTKSGTNQYHGGVFYQVRNTDLDANTYFNNINGLPRSIVKLTQTGFHVGGPILKNRLFFFTNFELRRLPQSAPFSRTVLTPGAATGVYTYTDSTGAQHNVNVLTLAQAAGFNGTASTAMTKTFSQINALTSNGSLINNVSSSANYITDTLNYQVAGTDRRNLSTTRVDYNVTQRNQISIVYSYNMYQTTPDILNGVVSVYPGTGTILGTSIQTGQHSNRFSGTISLRSAITNRLTNELRTGVMGGTTVFYDGAGSDSSYAQWYGYIPGYTGFSISPSGVTTITDPQRRNSPMRQVGDTMTFQKGQHMLNFGGDFAQVNLWSQLQSTESLPQVTLGVNTGDPVITGNTALFTNTNFPGATSTQLSDAEALYAALTGRVYSISRQVVQNTSTHQYGATPALDDDRQREYGLFAQDTWRVLPGLTLTLGLRFEQQMPFVNLTNTYTTASLASVWGISGIGNMFEPGVMTGVQPTYEPLTKAYATPKAWNPTVGFAWQVPAMNGILGWLFGNHQGASVLRAGYSINTIREGTETMTSIYGSNPGNTVNASVDPVNYPQYFGPAGSVTLGPNMPIQPTPTAPVFPMSPSATSSINAFDPNLKMGYVQSWNLGFEREVGKDNVVEVRYTGNHGVHEWRQVDLNEVNLFESGFLKEFYIAQNNLTIARGGNINNNTTVVNFGNQGLPGQQNTPILSTAFGSTSNTTYATYLRQNRAGSIANAIYVNQTYMSRLIAAGYPANMFVVNPAVASDGTYLVTNWGSSYYDAFQVEFRRRLARGLQFQGSYVFSKSLVDGATASGVVYSNPTTFRNLGLDKTPAGFDIRDAFKLNAIYLLPFGPGRQFLNNGNPIVKKALEGWEITGIDRNQSGTPGQLTASRTGMNQSDTGVVLYGMTAKQLQSQMGVYKTTGSNGVGQVFFLPQSFITNSKAAFEASGLNWSNINYSQPYLGPQLAPDQFGYRIYLYGPWQNHFDVSLHKITKVTERVNVEFRMNCLDCLNLTNFLFGTVNPSSASFGQTTSQYSDISNSQDPGARMIEFQLRVNF